MDTDASASHPAVSNRAARSAAQWATPLSILAGTVSVLWSARQLRAQPPSSPASAEPPAVGRAVPRENFSKMAARSAAGLSGPTERA